VRAARRCCSLCVFLPRLFLLDRGDAVKATAEVFFRHVKKVGPAFFGRSWKKRASDVLGGKDKLGGAPFFVVDGISYIQHRSRGLYFVLTTQFNESPAFASSLLSRISAVIKARRG
jgi:hypothetical protein